MSDTPRTDAAAEWLKDHGKDGLGPYTGRASEYVSAEFARQLEREVAELREALEEIATGKLSAPDNCIENMRAIARAALKASRD